MRKNRAFTLIELLVVVSIISLLMSIMLPALRRARHAARSVMCSSNLSQWGRVFVMYTTDNRGRFPNTYMNASLTPTTLYGKSLFWFAATEPYYQDRKLLLCPMAAQPAVDSINPKYAAWVFSAANYPGMESYTGTMGSYLLNGYATEPWNYMTKSLQKTTVYVNSWIDINQRQTSKIPLLGDGGGAWRTWPRDTDRPPREDGSFAWEGGENQIQRFCTDRHDLGRTNMLFMDWSMRSVGLKELWTLKWHNEFDTANRFTLAGGVTPDRWPAWMRRFEDF